MGEQGLRAVRMALSGVGLSVLSLLAACSTQDDAGTSPGDSVLVAGTSRVVARTLGGAYGPAIPAGATCHYEATFDLDLSGGQLAWNVCRQNGDTNDPASYRWDTGTHTLTSADRAQTLTEVQAVKVSALDNCGADAAAANLEVTSAAGKILYGDDFYSCLHDYQHYVTSGPLNQLFATLRALAQ
jgi:hypothetical protein